MAKMLSFIARNRLGSGVSDSNKKRRDPAFRLRVVGAMSQKNRGERVQ